MIEIKNINVSYKEQIVFKDSHIVIPDGKLTAISGKSGSGKTTLFYILGLISCARGYEYCFQGNIIDLEDNERKASLRKSKIGFIFQDKNLHEYLTIAQNIQLYCLISGVTYSDELLKDLLDKVHLNLDPHIKTEVLSGGEKQRLAIACALSKNPDLIIADEPTSALDSKHTKIIIELLKEIADEGKMVIIATHNKKIKEECDLVYHIENHQIISDTTIGKDQNVKELNGSQTDRKFYRWYSSFCFGKGKLERWFMMLIPAFVISICLFSVALKDSLIHQYKGTLNQFASNEVYVENKSTEMSEYGIQLLGNIEGVESVYSIYDYVIDTLSIQGKEAQLQEMIHIVPYCDYQKDYFHTKWEKGNGNIYLSYKTAELLHIEDIVDISISLSFLKQENYTVAGVLEKDYVLTQSQEQYVIYVPYQYFQEQTTQRVLLQLKDFESFKNISEAIHKVNNNYRIILSQDMYIRQMNQLEAYTKNLSTFIIVLCGLVTLVLTISQFFSVNNQKYEISVLKANGLSRYEILRMMFQIFCDTILKTFVSVIILLFIEKIVVYFFGIHVSLLSLKLIGLSLLFIGVVHFIPTFFATLFIDHFDVEKLLRF